MVTVFANQKGGVGKSTCCMNLAFMLGGLIVDLDPQGTITNTLVGESSPNMFDVLEGGGSITNMQKEIKNNIWLAPSGRYLSTAEISLAQRSGSQKVLREALAGIEKNVWIDTPPSQGVLLMNALVAARFVIVPVQPEYVGMLGLKSFLDTIDYVKNELNPNLEYKILVTFYNDRLNHHNEAYDALGKLPRFNTAISRTIRLAESMGKGIPLIEHDLFNKVSRQFLDLSYEVKRWHRQSR
jgi:chromosome partitioning protein